MYNFGPGMLRYANATNTSTFFKTKSITEKSFIVRKRPEVPILDLKKSSIY